MRVKAILLTCLISGSCYAQLDIEKLRSDIEKTARRISELKPITGIAHDEHVNIVGPQFDCKSLLPWVSRHKIRLEIEGQVIINLYRGNPEGVAMYGHTWGGKDRIWVTGRNDDEVKELMRQGLEYLSERDKPSTGGS